MDVFVLLDTEFPKWTSEYIKKKESNLKKYGKHAATNLEINKLSL